MNRSRHQRKICFVTASPMTVSAFLRPHILELCSKYDVTVLTNLSGFSDNSFGLPRVTFRDLNIRRDISLLTDLLVITKLHHMFQLENYTAVVSVNPKAGLLASLSGALAGVPIRIHWFTGQVWANKTFPFRQVLKLIDRIILTSTTSTLVDSFSQRDFLVRQKVGIAKNFRVLGNGSISGVDGGRFFPNSAKRKEMRSRLGIGDDVFLVIYLGRLNREKGVLDLASAFNSMGFSGESLILFVGPDEDRMSDDIRARVQNVGRRALFVAHTEFAEDYLAAADVMCLPSMREGFGTSVIEASAAGLPVIVSDIYGLRDSVLAGKTGIIFPHGDILALSQALDQLAHSPDLRAKLGKAGARFALSRFSQKEIVTEFLAFIHAEVSKLDKMG